MNNPFKVGDKVYHIFYGEGEVLDPDAQNHVKENGRTVLVKFLCGEKHLYAPKELSFKPWPAPVHDRPLEDGVYLVNNRLCDTLRVRGYYHGVWYFVDQNLQITTPCVRQVNDELHIIQKVG